MVLQNERANKKIPPKHAIRTTCFVCASLLLLGMFSPALSADWPNRPPPGVNNVWYGTTESDTVIVFVHGIFSDSRDAWLYENDDDPALNQYWPELIRTDPNFSGISIFLGGFYTGIGSGEYDIRDAANELYESLAISVSPATSRLLDRQNIIFIAHSTGGIVVRHLLVRHAHEFRDHNIGLVLIASPSVGSRDADRLAWLADLANQELGKQLQWNHPFLEELDKDFKNLVDKRDIPGLVGAEAIENHFIVKWYGIFRKRVLVEEQSAGRYFGEPRRLANTDHFSAVKPDSRRHPAYTFFRSFYETKFLPSTKTIKDSQRVLEAVRLEQEIVDHLNNPAFCRDALIKAERLTTLRPDYEVAYKYKGRAYYCLEDYRAAITSFEEALKIDPGYRDALFNKGVNLIMLGANYEAEAIFSDLLSRDSGDIPTRFNLTLMQAINNDYVKALQNARIVYDGNNSSKYGFTLLTLYLLVNPENHGTDLAMSVAREVAPKEPNYLCMYFGDVPRGLKTRDYMLFAELVDRVRSGDTDTLTAFMKQLEMLAGAKRC